MLAFIGLTEIGVIVAAISVVAAFIWPPTRCTATWSKTLSVVALTAGSGVLGAYAAYQWSGARP